MCVHTHTHTHTARGVPEHTPSGRDEILDKPKESRWTKFQVAYIHMCVNEENISVL